MPPVADWFRGGTSTAYWQTTPIVIGSLGVGYTLFTIRFSWGFKGFVATTANLIDVLQNGIWLGWVTWDGTGTAPNPMTDVTNADPPQYRWLWRELRVPRVVQYNENANLVLLEDTGPQEPVVVESMVRNNGGTVDIVMSIAPAVGDWDPTGHVNLWYWYSVGVRPPA